MPGSNGREGKQNKVSKPKFNVFIVGTCKSFLCKYNGSMLIKFSDSTYHLLRQSPSKYEKITLYTIPKSDIHVVYRVIIRWGVPNDNLP